MSNVTKLIKMTRFTYFLRDFTLKLLFLYVTIKMINNRRFFYEREKTSTLFNNEI